MCPVLTPPYSPVEPITEILHGIPVTDPYRWLEDQNVQRTRAWIAEQTRYARAYLDNIPGRDRIRTQIESLLAVDTVSTPWKVGSRYFYLKREAHQQQPTIAMREDESGNEAILADPNGQETIAAPAVAILSISADANLLAYSVKEGGQDFCAVRFVDVPARKHLKDFLPRGFCRGLAFSPDNRGFYYSHELCEVRSSTQRAIHWHELGTNTGDTEVYAGGCDPKLRLLLVSSPSGLCLGYCKRFSSDPQKSDFWIHDIASGARPFPIAEQIEGLFVPFLLDNDILALTDREAPNHRIVRIDRKNPGRGNWRSVVPESESRIQGLAVTRQLIVVAYTRARSTRLETFDLFGNALGEIPLPCEGTASLFPCRSDTDAIFYRSSSFAHPPSIQCYRVQTREQETWSQSNGQIDPSSLQMEQVFYASKDGTRVPMQLVSQKRRRHAGPLPTFLTAYGGFGKSIAPRYAAYSAYLIQRGCLFAVANLRGGAEFGEQWHLSAKRRNRQNAIDDFVAAAKWLVCAGYTQPGRLAIGGGSNAGLLVGAAFTQRPHAFRAVLCLGPLLDMLRYHLFDFASKWTDEYGSAENAGDFQTLLGYSPYHKVREGISYPAVMFVSGDADTRCNPMHARKMVAKLQAAGSLRPILLDYRAGWGHTPAQPLTRRIEALTDRLAFLSHELELDF
jgi:prolyl oligopeptidase